MVVRGWHEMSNNQIETSILPSEDMTVSHAVAESFGELMGTDPAELGFTLYEYIDPDALNDLFQPDVPETITVIFDVEDWDVRIRCTDSIHITIEEESDE